MEDEPGTAYAFFGSKPQGPTSANVEHVVITVKLRQYSPTSLSLHLRANGRDLLYPDQDGWGYGCEGNFTIPARPFSELWSPENR